jgi:hypothetical protein
MANLLNEKRDLIDKRLGARWDREPLLKRGPQKPNEDEERKGPRIPWQKIRQWIEDVIGRKPLDEEIEEVKELLEEQGLDPENADREQWKTYAQEYYKEGGLEEGMGTSLIGSPSKNRSPLEEPAETKGPPKAEESETKTAKEGIHITNVKEIDKSEFGAPVYDRAREQGLKIGWGKENGQNQFWVVDDQGNIYTYNASTDKWEKSSRETSLLTQ